MKTNAKKVTSGLKKMGLGLLASMLISLNSFAAYEVTSADNKLRTNVELNDKVPAILFSSIDWAKVSNPTNLVYLQVKIAGSQLSSLAYVLFTKKSGDKQWEKVSKGDIYEKNSHNHVVDFKFQPGNEYSVKFLGEAHSFYSSGEEQSLNMTVTLTDQEGRLILNSGEVPVRISESDPYAFFTKFAAISGLIYFR